MCGIFVNTFPFLAGLDHGCEVRCRAGKRRFLESFLNYLGFKFLKVLKDFKVFFMFKCTKETGHKY